MEYSQQLSICLMVWCLLNRQWLSHYAAGDAVRYESASLSEDGDSVIAIV